MTTNFRPTARNLALSALGDRSGNVSAHLNRLLAENPVAPAEASLARELAFGVVRRMRTLDTIMAAFRERQQAPVARVHNVLRLGLYQLLFLQRVPDFAAVNEAVEQVGRRLAHMRGFVNAVLRNVARSAGAVETGKYAPSADILPLSTDSYRRFDRKVFADPHTVRDEYLGQALSLPEDLAKKWVRQFGGLEGAMRIAIHANARPPVTLRVNAPATVPEVVESLRAVGVEAAAHANGASVVLLGPADLTKLEAFTRGWVLPQDAMATSVVAELDVKPGMRVLDLCAAPGAKTTHLAGRMGNVGEVVAVDVNEEKLARIRENCQRLGLSIVKPMLAEQVGSLEEGSFDLVLVDVPCSNTGVLARRPEARWRFEAKAQRALTADQRRLLVLGANFTRPGGVCAYSTCSLQDDENQLLVKEALRNLSSFRVVHEHRIMPAGADDPTRWRDGGFLAVLRR
jgi:16S rRNA (cytosine967-C5)-methyltransferase